MLPPEVLGEIVNRHAIARDLRPDIVMCVVLQESGGNPWAFRYERLFFQRYLAHLGRSELSGWKPDANELPSLDTEKMARATSYGLMQVMGETARSIGAFKNRYLTAMTDPEIGVEIGCRVLAYYLNRERDDYFRALSSYNAGTANSNAGRAYATKVLDRVAKGEHKKFLQG